MATTYVLPEYQKRRREHWLSDPDALRWGKMQEQMPTGPVEGGIPDALARVFMHWKAGQVRRKARESFDEWVKGRREAELENQRFLLADALKRPGQQPQMVQQRPVPQQRLVPQPGRANDPRNRYRRGGPQTRGAFGSSDY
jgi:hypothetical protein